MWEGSLDKAAGQFPRNAPLPRAAFSVATGCPGMGWTYLEFPPFPPTFSSFLISKSQRSNSLRATWDPRNKTFLSAEGSQVPGSGP